MTVTIWRWLLIDRIHMSVGIGSKDLYGFALSSLKGMKDIQADLVPNGKITITSGQFRTRLNYYPTMQEKIADIEIGVTKSKHRYFRLGLYPTKFGPGEFEHFKMVLDTLLPEFNYQRLFDSANVSYIELAADSLSHIAHSFIPFRGKCNCSHIFVDQEGNKGSTYLGSKVSALRFCIYDKRKQQLEKNKVATYNRHTRIEARNRYIGLCPCELPQMDNPFGRLDIADLKAARKISKGKAWQGFLNRCLEVGSAQALVEHPKQRQQYRKMLKTAAALWWNPADIWLGLPRAVNVIAP